MENYKKKTALFLVSQAVSLFGSSLVQYAIIWYITLKTQSGIMMTISTLCAFVPQVLISLFAGVWADKYNKKMLIILSDGMIACVTLLIAILFMCGIDAMWLLFLVLAVRSFGSGVQTPTTSAFIPELVPEKSLMKVNGINSTIQSIMLILSPAVSGALLSMVDLQYLFFIDVITAIIGISIFSFVKTNYKKKEETKKVKYFAEIKEGMVYTKNHKLVSRMLLYLVMFNLLMTPLAVLNPLMVTRTFGAEAWYLTLNEIIFFVGNILGGILISVWGGFKNKVATIGLGCIVCGILAILLGIPINFVIYLIWMGMIGITMPLVNTPFLTILQEEVEEDKYGRVFSLVSIISSAIVPISMLVYGPLSDSLKIESILIVTGILFILGSLILIRDKVIKEKLGHKEQIEPENNTEVMEP